MTGVPEKAGPATNAVAGVVTLVTLAVAFGLLAVGWPYFWIAFPIGFGGVLPAAVGLAKWYVADEALDDSPQDEREDALTALRERYANGEIDEAEFERRVERLLETESVERAESTYESGTGNSTETERNRERERA